MNDHAPRQHGFTLLEVLIALTLMAVLSVLSWRALDVTARSSEQLNADAHDTLTLMRVLGQLETDLSRHADTLPADPGAAPVAAQSVTEGEILLPGIHWTPPRLTIHRVAQPGTWQKVVWYLGDARLHRAFGPAANTLPLPAAHDAEALLDDVRAFTVRAWLPGQGWSHTHAPGAGATATGLEIAIALRHDDSRETYRKVVMLP